MCLIELLFNRWSILLIGRGHVKVKYSDGEFNIFLIHQFWRSLISFSRAKLDDGKLPIYSISDVWTCEIEAFRLKWFCK